MIGLSQIIFFTNILPWLLISEVLGFTSRSSSICSSMPWVIVNNGVTILAYNSTIWNSIPNAFTIHVLSHPFTTMLLISFTFIHWACNQLHIFGLRLLILKLTHFSYPLSIYSLMTNVVHVLNSTLNACYSGRCKITFVGCSSFMQFAGMKMTKMLGWSSFIQFINSLLLCINQQSNIHTIF